MGNTDSIPVVSQARSAFQAIAGDKKGARETQMKFLMGCPVVSQIGALGAAVTGNTEYSRKSQKYFLINMSALTDSIPVVGHVKGGIHYACGDRKGGDNAMKASSRTAGVIGGGIGGFIVGGPVGSVAGGIAGGAAMDGIITGAESAVKKKYTPSGHVHFATRAVKGQLDAGGYFDWIMTPVFDGVAGRAYAKAFQSIKAQIATSRSLKAAIQKAVEKGEITLQEEETINSLAKQLQSAAKKVQQEATASNAPAAPLESSIGLKVIKLRKEIGAGKVSGDVASVQKVLLERLSKVDLSLSGQVVGQCAEIWAVMKHQGLSPSKTFLVVYDPQTKSTRAVARCELCFRDGMYVNMGEIPPDAVHETVPISEEAYYKASLELLAPCQCEDEDQDKFSDVLLVFK